jgi:6-phosphofructokinase 1
MLGGTKLGSSRGGFDAEKIINGILAHGINQVYLLGGDGTHRGMYELYKKMSEKKL